jgi:hypothetical protein
MIRSRGEAVRDTTRWEHTIICKSYVLADMDIKYLTRFSRQISDTVLSRFEASSRGPSAEPECARGGPCGDNLASFGNLKIGSKITLLL